MKNSARTLVIVILSLGLLWLFLRGAHLDQVWGEIKRADGWWIALSLATTVGNMVIRMRAFHGGVGHGMDVG